MSHTSLGYQKITLVTANSATALTVPANAQLAMFVVRGWLEWRDDGVAPVLGTAMPMASPDDGSWLPWWFEGDLHGFQVVGDGVLHVTYYGN